MILKIIGWVIVVWLTGSTIYSTQYHLRNYFSSKHGDKIIAKDLEGPGQEKIMNRNQFLQHVIGMQIIKLFFIIFLMYLLMF